MNDDQITALAKEFTQCVNDCHKFLYMEQGEQPTDFSDGVLDLSTKCLESFLQWLSCRYRLVEKSEVEEECHKAKFKVGDVVHFEYGAAPMHITKVKISDGKVRYRVAEVWADESDLEPYPVPEDLNKEHGTCTDDCSSQDNIGESSGMAGHIIKDSSNEQHRLHIAAMAMQGILSDIDMLKTVLQSGMETMKGEDISFRAVAKASFLFADALIKESQKENDE